MHRAAVCMDGCCHTVAMAVLDEKGAHFTNGREETASFCDDDSIKLVWGDSVKGRCGQSAVHMCVQYINFYKIPKRL